MARPPRTHPSTHPSTQPGTDIGTPITLTLASRKATHGDYADTAHMAQALKNAMRGFDGFYDMGYQEIEALDMIASKIARIVCGDATEADHWHDIAGYATLVEEHLP